MLVYIFSCHQFWNSQDSPEENFTPVSPEDVFTSSSLSSKHFENSAAMKDKAEHRSQVSVLEKFVENITSLPSIVSQPGRFSGLKFLLGILFVHPNMQLSLPN